MRYTNDSFEAQSISRDGSRKFLQASANAKRSALGLMNSHIFAKISVILRQ
jgi:hypothetical protein